jgi:hypothetical protein
MVEQNKVAESLIGFSGYLVIWLSGYLVNNCKFLAWCFSLGGFYFIRFYRNIDI